MISEWFSKCCKIIGNASQNLPNGFLGRLGVVLAQKNKFWSKLKLMTLFSIEIMIIYWFLPIFEQNLHFSTWFLGIFLEKTNPMIFFKPSFFESPRLLDQLYHGFFWVISLLRTLKSIFGNLIFLDFLSDFP